MIAFLADGSDSILGPEAREASFAELLCTMWLLSHANTMLVLAYKERKPIESRFFDLLWQYFEGSRLPPLTLKGLPESANVHFYTFRPKPAPIGDSETSQRTPYCARHGEPPTES